MTKKLQILLMTSGLLYIQAHATGQSSSKGGPTTTISTLNTCSSSLEIGHSIVINQPNLNPAYTPISAHYRLVRIDEKSYRSEVGVLFKAKDNSITNQEMDEFKDRVKLCLASMDSFLKGPNGETLQIRLAEDLTSFPSDAIVPVTVSKEVTRENARTYSLSAPCPTVIHEILHLHGLVDEYADMSSNPQSNVAGSSPAFACRSIGSNWSVMSDQDSAYQQVKWGSFDIWEYDFCSRTQNMQDQETCFSRNVSVEKGTRLPEEQLEKLGARNFKMLGTQERQSLLGSIQFNVIVYPGCKENGLYYMCASNAYLSPPSCLPTPPECKNPLLWTGLN